MSPFEKAYTDALAGIERRLHTSAHQYDSLRLAAKWYPTGPEELDGRMAARARVAELVRAEMELPVPKPAGQLDLLGGLA